MSGVSTADNSWSCALSPDRPRIPLRDRGPLHTVGNPGPTHPAERRLTPVAFRQITDGLSKTIAVGERSIELTGGVDSHMRRPAWAYSYCSYNKSSAHIDPHIFMRDFDACAREVNYDLNIVCKHGWSSFHPGGMHFVHCDGSAHFQTDDIDLELFAAQATIAGGE